ncbi:hypothetical protein HBI18_106190 [Parastagonospora nodorum]|nr:hypothetical protein HBI18_106190 [Parastagonospora nodorum]
MNLLELLRGYLTALLNLQSLASKRSALSSSDLNRRRTNPTIATSLAKQIKTNEDRKKSTHRDDNNVQLVRDNIEELIYISKVKNNRNNLNIIVTNPISREFSRVDIKSLTRLSYNISKFHKSKNIQLLRPVFKLQRYDYYNLQDRPTPRELGSIYVLQIISKLDEVPTREPSSHIKTELYLLRDNSRKFYHLVITSEDTHYKQIIKKAYIMLLERALLILFIT